MSYCVFIRGTDWMVCSLWRCEVRVFRIDLSMRISGFSKFLCLPYSILNTSNFSKRSSNLHE